MADILKAPDGRKSYKHGVGPDGKPRATVPASPGMIANPDRGHEANQEQRKGNLALAGKPKAHQNVGTHQGMTQRQQSGMVMGHATSAAPLDDEKLSLDPTVSKNLTPPNASPGMRTR